MHVTTKGPIAKILLEAQGKRPKKMEYPPRLDIGIVGLDFPYV